MKPKSHKQKILEHLQSGRTLTELQSLYEFGRLRLGARIYELRKAGHNIIDVGKKHYAEYKLQQTKITVTGKNLSACTNALRKLIK